MRQFDFYNPVTHHGLLPVRVMQHNIIDWFEKAAPDFMDEMIGETTYNGMQKAITYQIDRTVITIACEITPQKQIVMYENFNQFLWSTCYSLIVLFDEAIQIPLLSNKFNGTIDYDNIHIRKAISVFKEGFNLFRYFNDYVFFDLPNPEKYNEYEQKYIEKANGVFVAAMTYMLLHEFGHQYYGHLNYDSTQEQSKRDEYVVDDYAYDKIATKFGTQYEVTFKIGLVAALSSLYFFDDTLKGGDYHPDPDLRLKRQLDKMGLSDLDYLWGIASLSFRLWTITYNKEIILPLQIENYKRLFDLTLEKINEIKNTTANNGS